MVYALLSCLLCLISLHDTRSQALNNEERPWWQRFGSDGDLNRRDLRGDKEGFWAVRGKRSAPLVEYELAAEEEKVMDDEYKYLDLLKDFLEDMGNTEATLTEEDAVDYITQYLQEQDVPVKRGGFLKPNGLFGSVAVAGGKRAIVKPNGLFTSFGKRALKPNGLFTINGKRNSLKPNGLFSLNGKRTSFKPNGLFNVAVKRSLKPNGLFNLAGKRSPKPNGIFLLKRVFKPNGLFTPLKRHGLKPNGLFSAYKRPDAELEQAELFVDNGIYTQDTEDFEEPMTVLKKDDKSFWAVRGKKDEDFWAVRGKRSGDEDFWAVRGKRDLESSEQSEGLEPAVNQAKKDEQ